jgi:hypothetical protein
MPVESATQRQLVDSYEQLRAVALGSTASAHGQGLALMLRRGMAAWMQGWSQCCAAARTQAQPRVQRSEVIARPEVVAPAPLARIDPCMLIKSDPVIDLVGAG